MPKGIVERFSDLTKEKEKEIPSIKIVHNQKAMITKTGKEFTLDTSLIGRIFDKIPKNYFAESPSLVAAFKNEIDHKDIRGTPFMDQIIMEARKELLTTAGELKSEVVDFLSENNENFKAYDSFTAAQKQQLKFSLIFSLAHTHLSIVEEEYRIKHVGEIKNENEITLKIKQTPTSDPEMKKLEQERIAILKNIKNVTDKIMKSNDFMQKFHKNIINRIAEVERSHIILENFMDFCIQAKSQKLSSKDIDLKAESINTEFKLGLNTHITRKKGFFEKNTTRLSISDQLLELIGKQYPDIVKNTQARWQKNFIHLQVQPFDIEMVLVKSGMDSKALKSFDLGIRDAKAEQGFDDLKEPQSRKQSI
jgi:hypothetical protein